MRVIGIAIHLWPPRFLTLISSKSPKRLRDWIALGEPTFLSVLASGRIRGAALRDAQSNAASLALWECRLRDDLGWDEDHEKLE